jgi:hypothetical protein
VILTIFQYEAQKLMKRVSSLGCLLVAAIIGCGGPDATVQGTVTVGGEIAHQGTVQFHPVKGGPTAYGNIADNGSYSLRVGQGDLSDPNAGMVQSGEYIITVVVNMPSTRNQALGEAGPPEPGARLSAEKYATKESSNLHATVNPGANVVPLELDRATAEVNDEAVADGAVDGSSAGRDSSGPTSTPPSAADTAPSPESSSPAGAPVAEEKSQPMEPPAAEGSP